MYIHNYALHNYASSLSQSITLVLYVLYIPLHTSICFFLRSKTPFLRISFMPAVILAHGTKEVLGSLAGKGNVIALAALTDVRLHDPEAGGRRTSLR